MSSEILEKKTGETLDNLISRLATITDDRLAVDLRNEFNTIVTQTPGFEHFRLNPGKNRYNGNVFLYDSTRVALKDSPNGDYIHASYISTAHQSRRFILTQAPLAETMADFWSMVAQEQVQVVVAICQFDKPDAAPAEDPFPIYWPSNKGVTKTYGEVTVQCESTREIAGGAWTRLKWSSPTKRDGAFVAHLHLESSGWDYGGKPTAELMELLELTWREETDLMKLNGQRGLPPPICIHCGSGTTRSGQFTALAIATEAIRRNWHFSMKDIIVGLQSQRYGVLREPVQIYALLWAILRYGERHEELEVEDADREAYKRVKEMIDDALSGRN